MLRRYPIGKILTVAALLLGLVGCGTQTTAPPPAQPSPAQPAAQPAPAGEAAPAKAAPSTPPKPIRVRVGSAVDVVGYAPIYLADLRGYYKEAGLEVQRQTLQGGSALNAAFIAGDIEVAVTATTSSIKTTAAGQDALVVYALNKQQVWYAVVGKEFAAKKGFDAGAPLATRFVKLKGMSIGAPSLGGTTEIMGRFVLEQGGLKDNDVSVVKVGSGSALVAAVEKGQVDGVVQPPPAPQELVRRGIAVMAVRPDEIPLFKKNVQSVIMVKDKWAAQNTETLKKFLRATDRAKQSILADKELAIRDMQKVFPQMDEQTLRDGLEAYIPTFGPNGAMDREDWENTLKLMKLATPDMDAKMDPGEGIYWTGKYLP